MHIADTANVFVSLAKIIRGDPVKAQIPVESKHRQRICFIGENNQR
jgi:hypothetical protein